MKYTNDDLFSLLEVIPDPEIPVLTIADLGIIRGIRQDESEVVITITPTYSGCPAMNQFEDDILAKLKEHGINNARIETTYDPPWTTDWLTDHAKQKLQDYGIAPPQEKTSDKSFLKGNAPRKVICPQCKSTDTRLVSQFGSTACKSLYQCNTCKEPFDYFKCI
jgi:ring-1,2-phenylacetyl-CoA epoxidase subunit PaaD